LEFAKFVRSQGRQRPLAKVVVAQARNEVTGGQFALAGPGTLHRTTVDAATSAENRCGADLVFALTPYQTLYHAYHAGAPLLSSPFPGLLGPIFVGSSPPLSGKR